LNESYIPYVVETSIGLDRTFLSIISNGYTEEMVPTADGGEELRIVMKIPHALAPVKLAILPLLKKDGLPEVAGKIMNELKFDFNCQYEEKDTIGRRYRRQDAIGTPYCITIDHQTLQDSTVTIRDRDTMLQERVSVAALQKIVSEKVSMRKMLEKI
jgi:glycyl-tRNA synthetase